jgi:signal transduction histidine kinase
LLLARLSDQPPVTFLAGLEDVAVPETALFHLSRSDAGFADFRDPALRAVHQAALQYAFLARRLAERTGRHGADAAWVAGLLAPLGWLAACAAEPDRAVACLADPEWKPHPAATEERYWGFDQSALARRLARRWQLPPYLTAVSGHLGLPGDVAGDLGADLVLFQLVQLAVGLVQEGGDGLGLAVGATPVELAVALGLPEEELLSLQAEAKAFVVALPAAVPWQSPTDAPLLGELLTLAVENRRLRGGPLLIDLEREADTLQHAFRVLKAGEAERLQTQKLNALAEFAAGAGHEINNPLAVISGQAQYLLIHEADPGRQRALQAIINQTHRIHQLLRDVMHFARPPKPERQSIDLAALAREAAQTLDELARERNVRLHIPDVSVRLPVTADPAQVRTTLTCLLRNAIEAAPADGWAAIRLETGIAGQVEVVVEDSGPGLAPSQREHLFDPFYSGRQAGRGRGLGLPTAWRLARAHGGDVRHVALPEGPTRFVLRLPLAPMTNGFH